MMKTLIYPFSNLSYSLVELLRDQTNLVVATDRGTSLVGHDAGFVLNLSNIGIKVVDIDEVDLSQIGKVYLVNDYYSSTRKNEKIIKKLNDLNIPIISLQKIERKSFDGKVPANQLQLTKPVIFVSSLFPDHWESLIAIRLQKEFIRKNLSCRLFTFDLNLPQLPEYKVYHGGDSRQIFISDFVEEVVRAANDFEKSEDDILLFQVPNGYTRALLELNYYGAYYALCRHLITPDFEILNIPANFGTEEVVNELIQQHEFHYHTALDAVFKSNRFHQGAMELARDCVESAVFMPFNDKESYINHISEHKKMTLSELVEYLQRLWS